MEIVDRDNSSSTSRSNNGTSSPTIRKVEYPHEIIEQVNELIHSKAAEIVKKPAIGRLIGTKQCSVCQGLPEYEVIYPVGDATKIERYCTHCFNKREESDRINPNDYFVMATKLYL